MVVKYQSPRESAVAMVENPDDAPWEALEPHLLAEAVDMLRLLVWSKTKDAQNGRHQPKPVERPGRRPERMGSKPLPLDEMKIWLGW